MFKTPLHCPDIVNEEEVAAYEDLIDSIIGDNNPDDTSKDPFPQSSLPPNDDPFGNTGSPVAPKGKAEGKRRPDTESEDEVGSHNTTRRTELNATNASDNPNPMTRTVQSEGRPFRHRLRTIRLRRKGTKGVNKKVMTVPLEAWCPATRVVNPIARTCFTVNANPIEPDTFETDCDQEHPSSRGLARRKKRRVSEKQGWRLLQAYTKYRDASGVERTGRVQLDSHSNVNYSLPGVSLSRRWGPNEKTKVIGLTKEFKSKDSSLRIQV